MLEGGGVLLERREAIRLREVARVARLAEEAQVGQTEALHERSQALQLSMASLLTGARMERSSPHERVGERKASQESGRSSHSHWSSDRMTSAVTSSNFRILVPL
jgi:hypothetical protein